MKFSLALILFTLVLTPLYLLILKSSAKGKKVVDAGESKSKIEFVFAIGGYLVMGILVLLQFMSALTTELFIVLYPIITVFLLFKLRSSQESERAHTVLTAVIFHLIVLSILWPSPGIMLTERSSALAMLKSEGAWNPQWTYIDPYYGSFPMDLGLFYTVSEITSISYIDLLNSWIVGLFFTVAYDLVLYTLIKRLSGSWRVGVFGILLFAFTPPAIIDPQPQCVSSLFLLISLLAFFKVFMRVPSISNVFVANFCFAAAILTHGTSAVGVLLLWTLLAVSCIVPRLGKVTTVGSYKRAFLGTVLATFTIIVLVRWVYLGGLERVVTPINVFIRNLLGFTQNGSTLSQYVPLYDRAVSPLHAYTWSMPASMALAFVLYHFIHKKSLKSMKVVLVFTMCLTAAGLQFVGFLGATFSASVGLQRYLGQSSFILLIPAAAIVGMKVLKASSRSAVGFIMISMILFSGIGITDPVFSPQLYPELKTVNVARSEDYLEGSRLHSILSNETSIVSTYEILMAVEYLNTLKAPSGISVRSYVGSLKLHRILTEKLLEEKEAVPGVTYIWTPEISAVATDVPVNVIYDSGRHVAVRRAD